jgi:hypothetical protein
MTMEERRTAKQGAEKLLQEAGYNEAIARASGAASMEKARTRKERLQGLTDQLRANHEANNRNAAQIYGVAQSAVSKLAAEAEMPSTPQISRSKALPSAKIPKKGAKQRGALLDTLKTTRDRDAANAAGIYTVAKVATSKLSDVAQSEEAPTRAIAGRLPEAKVSNPDLDRKPRRVKRASQSTIDNAPVQIPNQRKSNEPRRRGRSVD